MSNRRGRQVFARSLQPIIEDMLDEFRIVYVAGPRQCGKTTLTGVIAQARGMAFASLDDQTVLHAARTDPHGLVRSYGDQSVVLDEFQLVPELIPAIKQVSDHLKPEERGRFLLTGSADVFRSSRVQEALPGHMARMELMPLALSEIHRSTLNLVDFLMGGNWTHPDVGFTSREEFATLILQGGFPEPRTKSPRARRAWYASYIDGRLLKDFETQHAARGDYHSKVTALVTLLAGRSGNLLKYASVANDLGLNDGLVRSYIDVLDLMFVLKRLPSYVRNRAKRTVVGMAKLHFIDTGLAAHLLGLRAPEQVLESQFYGGLLENLLFLELYKQAAWAQEPVSFFHFRDKRKNEVDVVLERDNGEIVGVEVKASSTVRATDFSGLAKLAEYAGERFSAGVVFYTGQNVLPFGRDGLEFYAVPIGLALH